MSCDERCSKCSRPYAPDYPSWQCSDTTCGMSPGWNLDGEKHDDCINECLYATVQSQTSRISALETLAHAAIELRGWQTTAPPEVLERFDAAVKGAGL